MPSAFDCRHLRDGPLIMPLTLRPTGGHARVYQDRQDWTFTLVLAAIGYLASVV
jgi:hypothetical protein